MGVGSGFVICCQRFFLVACFFSSPLFIPLFIPESKTFIPLARYFYAAFTGRGIIMELLSFLLPLHRFSEWKAAGFCKEPVFYN